MVVLMYFSRIAFMTLFFIGCNSKVVDKRIDLKDCIVTVPFHYDIKQVNKSNIVLVSNDIENSLYHIHFQNNLDAPKGHFKKFLNSYSPSRFSNRGNLKVVEGMDTHLKEKVYFLIGKNFYIVYFKPNKTIDKIISECNQNWNEIK